jgi:predicted alpha-1,2-mannosidase
MKQKVGIFLFLSIPGLLFLFSCTGYKENPESKQEPTAWVDPFIGVEIGNTLPGAQVPFGMVRLGPDVAPPNHTTGYRSDKPIRGFSHNHVSGTGGGARYGNIMVIPEIESKNLNPEPKKYNEYARPGYYSVTLSGKEGDVQSELTATARAGMHRYTFFKLEKPDTLETLLLNYVPVDTIHANILIDASSIIDMVVAESTHNTGGSISIVSDREIEGHGEFKGGWGGENPYKICFVAQFDKPFHTSGTWKDGKFDTGLKKRKGANIGAFAGFTLKQRGQVQLKVGISYVSIDNARKNLEEVPLWNFDKVRMDADSAWNTYLNTINIEGGTPEQRTVFYTALYHTLVLPTSLGTEGNPGWKSDKPHYWDFYTLWDTYRTVMPLHTLIIPEKQTEIVQSLIDIYDHRGWLPDAWTAGDFAYVQGGNNADVVIADAVIKGLKGIDVAKAYTAIKKDADSVSDNPYKYGRYLEEYDKLGYASSNIKNGSSKTLEYAYNDFCVAQVAKVLDREKDYQKYLKRSYNSFNLFNPETRFFWAKDASGNWIPGFSPTFKRPDYWNGPYFYEGTPWGYSTYFPHDMKFLIAKHGGNSNFVAFLDELFDGEHYEMGNEPGFLTPYLYHYAGRPDKSFERVRALLPEFKVGRAGLPGQDDSGAMSAWFVFSALGFYPVAGQDVYLIGGPLFPKSKLRLENGKTFTIIANHASGKNLYVQSAKLNGKNWDKCWFRHSDIENGGELIMEMGATPSKWGRRIPPPSVSD